MRVDFSGNGVVVFEGCELPLSIKAMHSALPFWGRLSPGAQEWVMDLHYCWGRVRTLPSRRVLRYAADVLGRLEGQEAASIASVLEVFPEAGREDAENMVGQWKEALRTIQARAASRNRCSWSMMVTDDEVEKNLRVALGLAGKDPKNQHIAVVQKAPVGLERNLRMKSQEELLQFLAKLTDAMSTRVTAWERFTFPFRNRFGFF